MGRRQALTLAIIAVLLVGLALGGAPLFLSQLALAGAALYLLWQPVADTKAPDPIEASEPPPTPEVLAPPEAPPPPEPTPGGLSPDQVLNARRVAHDLNNALTTIISCAGELQMSVPPKGDLGEVVADLDQAGARAVRLARDLRNVLRNKVTPSVSQSSSPGGNETILLVDDEQSVRRTIGRLLSGAGYDVLEASSAPEALKVCDENSARLSMVLTDVWMPEVDGVVLAREVVTRYPDVRILLMTGHVAETEVLLGETPESAAVLAKPFSAERLMHRVRETLDGGAPLLPIA